MSSLKKNLKARLKGAKRIAVLGVGSELRCDDAVGILAARQIQKRYKSDKEAAQIKVFIGASAPENLTGKLKEFGPSHLIIIDSAHMGKQPGTVRLLKPEEIQGISFSTHRMPLNIMINYILAFIKCDIIIIGIQPKIIDFGEAVSREAIGAAKDVAQAIC